MNQRSTLFAGKHLRLVQQDGWEFVERPNASAVVAIIAVTAAGELVLVEQHRVPLGQSVIELPAGLVGDTDASEDRVTAARRELLEETGYAAEHMTVLAIASPSAGLTNEMVTFVRATSLTKTAIGGGTADENITVHEVAVDRIDHWLGEQARAGKAIDLKIYAGLHFLNRPDA